MGIYFLEKGASQRGSVCIYDRSHSSIQEATADEMCIRDSLYVVAGLEILQVSMDISWYFQGKESFQVIALCSGTARIMAVVLILLFVKKPEDLSVYVFLYCGTLLLGFLSQWLYPVSYTHLDVYKRQSSTYVFDTWSGKMEPEKNILNYALFVSFFPTITSGPIQRARKMLPQIRKRTMPNFREVEEAVFVFLWGAFLKMIIADRIAIFTDAVYLNMSTYGGAILILCALMYLSLIHI